MKKKSLNKNVNVLKHVGYLSKKFWAAYALQISSDETVA